MTDRDALFDTDIAEGDEWLKRAVSAHDGGTDAHVLADATVAIATYLGSIARSLVILADAAPDEQP